MAGGGVLPWLARVARAVPLGTSREVDVLQSRELPARPDEAQRFLAEGVVIALAGADVDDLSKAR